MPNMEHRQGRAGDDDLEPEDAEEYEDVEDLHEDMGPVAIFGGEWRCHHVSSHIPNESANCFLTVYSCIVVG